MSPGRFSRRSREGVAHTSCANHLDAPNPYFTMFPWDKAGGPGKAPRTMHSKPYAQQSVQHRMEIRREKERQHKAVERQQRQRETVNVLANSDKQCYAARQRKTAFAIAAEASLNTRHEGRLQAARSMDRTRAQQTALALELERRKSSEESKRRDILRICAQDEGLKDLQKHLKTAYMVKERATQLQELEQRNAAIAKREAEFEAQMDARREELKREDEAKRVALRAKHEAERREMNETAAARDQKEAEEAFKQYMREKEMVDAVMRDTRAAQLAAQQAEHDRKKAGAQAFKELLIQIDENKRRKQADAEAEAATIQAYKDSVEARNEGVAEALAAKEAAKMAILNRMKEEFERKLAIEQQMNEDQALLREEEANLRREEEDRKKREWIAENKRSMLEANAWQNRLKAEKIALEAEQEAERVRIARAAFDEVSRLEREKEAARERGKVEYKKAIDMQMDERRAIYEFSREQALAAAAATAEQEAYEQMIVEEARKRLMSQHAGVLEYAPPAAFASTEPKQRDREPDNVLGG